MQSEKHATLEYCFLSSNKNARSDEQEIEPNTAVSSSLSLSTPEIQDLSCSSSLSSDQTSTVVHDSASSIILSSSLNENSHRKYFPNHISMSCNDEPAQKN
ncbi:unnamed protein product [Rotaria magnacalcarata]|uniref:Uncharacterized protein n=1 Tax=Rotaria magnacalcarata TaxID=392030 RepID=A0A820DVR4_9BILA|nr:unnamed protein product [Rotaria magnacalcarata]CAF2236257.1 unnamed protein product [Rotaria magnacalcarata]CAF4237526.1 unnamed protein product [Rotaria magnacalcarata]CAF4275526.1 unnamed protein product [Rotaria magnacalcarata]